MNHVTIIDDSIHQLIQITSRLKKKRQHSLAEYSTTLEALDKQREQIGRNTETLKFKYGKLRRTISNVRKIAGQIMEIKAREELLRQEKLKMIEDAKKKRQDIAEMRHLRNERTLIVKQQEASLEQQHRANWREKVSSLEVAADESKKRYANCQKRVHLFNSRFVEIVNQWKDKARGRKQEQIDLLQREKKEASDEAKYWTSKTEHLLNLKKQRDDLLKQITALKGVDEENRA